MFMRQRLFGHVLLVVLFLVTLLILFLRFLAHVCYKVVVVVFSRCLLQVWFLCVVFLNVR